MEIVEIISTGAGLVMAAINLGQTISEKVPRRQCNIQIRNHSDRYVLINPGMFICRGSCSNPLPPKIPPSGFGDAVFDKTPCTGRGFSGVVTYDLHDGDTGEKVEELAVFFKNPYNPTLKSNECAVGVFDVCRGCNVNLHDDMATKTDITFIRGKAEGLALTHMSKDVTLSATMSGSYSSVIKVDLSDS